MNEADTRAELIDKQLEASGWIASAETGVRVRREFNINDGEIKASGIRTKRLIADYILEYRNRKLAVIEAKSNELDVSEGVAQAKLYAQKLQLGMSYAANGKEIYEINHVKGSEGKVPQFPSPQELWDRTFSVKNEWLNKFNDVPFEDWNGTMPPRYYQEVAVNRAMEAIANDKKRVLLTLATGTGKTRISLQIARKLFKSRWTLQGDGKRQPRILFLADRNILANQAFLEFSAFDPDALVRIDPKDISKRGAVPKNGSVFFTIFQTFMSGKDGAPYFGEYEPDFFDLIIIDECHRGGANNESTWRGILDYFSSAVHLGLTATPKRTDNADTYDYFGDPVYIYSLKEGINDGFLTPFKVKRIQSNIDDYLYTPDDDVVEGEIEEGKVYTESDFNKKIIIEERERHRVKQMLNSMNEDDKTIVFCANQEHAGTIRDLINQEAKSTRVDYCVRVTANDGLIGDTYLKQFQDNEKTIPTVLTTSQKLSTGVDARNVRNIVLLRPVNSMIEFKQIIGRGTRLYEGKNYFTIIDFVDAYHLFNDEEWDGEPIEPEEPAPEKPPRDIPEGPELPPEGPDDPEEPSPPKVKIKLSDGKVREIQSISSTYFYVDGKPISAEAFLQRLFDVINLPELLGSEEQLKEIWSNPVSRGDLLKKLEDEGCHREDLEKIQELIDAKDSDLYDVLEYIAYARTPVSRIARVETGRGSIFTPLNEKQKEFVGFVLKNYIEFGIDELDISKLSSIVSAKYGSVSSAPQELGDVSSIKNTFIDFQRHLYS
jgi:type I restriction enzyme R subunit